MGTGKSSVGRLAAESLQFEFVDTDELIESETGQTIEEIFQKQGEAAFRELEKQVVEKLSHRQNLVISTGGGLVADPANLASLKTYALVICLWAPPEVIWERGRTQTNRPLLKAPDPLAKIRELFAKRDPLYRQADVLIQTNQRAPKEVAQQVLLQFELAQR